MSQDELEKRIRTLEIRAAMMLGSIATLAICCVAFLGFEYYRIPNQIQKQVEDKIGKEAWEYVDKVVKKAERMEGKSVQVFEDVWNDTAVYPPTGTKKDDWVAFILPVEIGLTEDGKEIEEKDEYAKDNALMSFHLRLVDKKKDKVDGVDGWKAEVKYRYRSGEHVHHMKYHTGKSKVILVPR
jgi:hypothetical protein